MADHEHEHEVGILLADRAYLFSLFHVIFGALPTRDSTAAMFGPETARVLGVLRGRLGAPDAVRVARQQLVVCGRTLAECVDETCVCIAKDAEYSGKEDFVESLRGDYTKLFQVPCETFVRPWESPYVGKEEMLFQEGTLDVRRFYHESGFKLKAEKHFPDDHIAAMMEYLAHLSRQSYEAYADGADDEVRRVLATQRRFLDKHILTWVDVFADSVIGKDRHAYYAAFAGAMAAFVVMDRFAIAQLFRYTSSTA